MYKKKKKKKKKKKTIIISVFLAVKFISISPNRFEQNLKVLFTRNSFKL